MVSMFPKSFRTPTLTNPMSVYEATGKKKLSKQFQHLFWSSPKSHRLGHSNLDDCNLTKTGYITILILETHKYSRETTCN